MEYSVEPLSPEANEAALTAIKADPGQWFSKLLPRRLAEDGGPFVCLVQMQTKEDRVGDVIEFMTAVHEETDEKELNVYSHRILQGKWEVDQFHLALIIEYDEPQAFYDHYKGQNIVTFYSADALVAPPRLSFYRDYA